MNRHNGIARYYIITPETTPYRGRVGRTARLNNPPTEYVAALREKVASQEKDMEAAVAGDLTVENFYCQAFLNYLRVHGTRGERHMAKQLKVPASVGIKICVYLWWEAKLLTRKRLRKDSYAYTLNVV